MFIAQERQLTQSEEHIFRAFLTTYPTDQNKFNEYLQLNRKLDRQDQMIKSLIRELLLLRHGLSKIRDAKNTTKSRIVKDLEWCQEIANETFSKINPKETK